MSDATRIDVYLICNAKYHDTSFARLELLTLLAEHEDVVVRVAEDYRDAVGPGLRCLFPHRVRQLWPPRRLPPQCP